MFLTGSKVGLGMHTLASHSGPSGNTPLLRRRCRGCGNSVFIGFEGWVKHTTFRRRCRGCGNSVFIGFEGWAQHTSRGSGPSAVNGFEGRVRHTLASHSGPSGNTPLDGVSPFRKRCRGCGNSAIIGFEGWVKHTSRGSGPSVFNGLGTPWHRIRDLPETRH